MSSSADGNQSQWVSGVQDRHRGGKGEQHTPETSKSASSAAELEEEIRRSREERAKRRSQTVGLVSPFPLGGATELDTTASSRADTSHKLLGKEGVKSPLKDAQSTNDMRTAYSPPSFTSSSSPPKRTNALLERYGGTAGPTGVTRPGSQASPASLANFIGGKASGPRLGKLQGDGRTAPPEAAEYLAARALPDLTASSGGASLASFLEARANGKENIKSSSPPKYSSGNASPSLRNGNASSSLAATTQTDVSIGVRQDRATSPLKVGQSVVIKQPQLDSRQPQLIDTTRAATVPGISPPTSTTGISPAFNASQSTTDRMPTASLTRLKSKRMVEQRVREAEEKEGVDQSVSQSPVLQTEPAWKKSSQDSVEGSGGVKAKWSVAEDKQPSPTKERKNVLTPATFGNALPGMSKSQAVPTRNLYAANRRDTAESDELYSPPVRLPGMGSSQSPFATKSTAVESAETSTQPLEQLMKGRAKPKRMMRPSAINETSKAQSDIAAEPHPEERISRQDSFFAREAFNTSRRTPSPRKPELHLSMNAETPVRPVRQDSVPGSADKRIADSTAALEALLEGKHEKTPTLERSKMTFVPDKVRQAGTLKIARNKDNHVSIDTSVIQRCAAKGYDNIVPKTMSVEVFIVKPDGKMEHLLGEEAKVLYETETQVITHRSKHSNVSASVSTKVYARIGIRARLLIDPSCMEARKVQETGKEHGTAVIDARQGRESIELAKALGGILITREGSRRGLGKDSIGMYQVRDIGGAQFVDQVDMLTSSLCSAHSAVIILQKATFVWHGKGSISSNRQTALQFARQISIDSQRRVEISEYEEEKEEDLFWTCFDKSIQYPNAWHHRFTQDLSEYDLQPRLFSIQGTGSMKRLFDQSDFSLLDVRRDGIHILQLPLEIYVLIGPEARSRRKEIQLCIEAASNLAKQVSNRRGLNIMIAPVHVVVFPTIPPRELKSAFRYWHDEHLNGKGWQRAGLGMNVWESQSALQQLDCHEFPLWQVNDELFLPVGVGLDDVQGIDV